MGPAFPKSRCLSSSELARRSPSGQYSDDEGADKSERRTTISALIGRVSPMVSLLYRLGRDSRLDSRFWQAETVLQCDMIVRNPTRILVFTVDFKAKNRPPRAVKKSLAGEPSGPRSAGDRPPLRQQAAVDGEQPDGDQRHAGKTRTARGARRGNIAPSRMALTGTISVTSEALVAPARATMVK